MGFVTSIRDKWQNLKSARKISLVLALLAFILSWCEEEYLPNDITADGRGNAYVTAAAKGRLTSRENALLIKYDAAGNRLWSRMIGPATTYFPVRVAMDRAGYIYAAGTAVGKWDNRRVKGWRGVFLAKYDNKGRCVWRRVCGVGESVQDLKTDGEDGLTVLASAYGERGSFILYSFDVQGRMLREIRFGHIEHEPGHDDVYRARIGPDGSVYAAARREGGSLLMGFGADGEERWHYTEPACRVESMTMDDQGRLYLGGFGAGAFVCLLRSDGRGCLAFTSRSG